MIEVPLTHVDARPFGCHAGGNGEQTALREAGGLQAEAVPAQVIRAVHSPGAVAHGLVERDGRHTATVVGDPEPRVLAGKARGYVDAPRAGVDAVIDEVGNG